MGVPVEGATTMPAKKTGDAVLAARIRARRLYWGLSPEELGDQMAPKAAGRTVRSWEDATGAPQSIEGLRQLARILHTSVAYLVGETDEPLTPSDRLRRVGIDPGNIEQLSDENLAATIAGLVEEFASRPMKRTPPLPTAEDQQGGDDADARDSATSGAG